MRVLIADDQDLIRRRLRALLEIDQEIRVESRVESDDGEPAKLKPGAPVEVTIEADEKDTVLAVGKQTEKKATPRDKVPKP